MRFNRLDLNLLVALDALLSEKSITRAARRLHLSQSAASGALGRLREYFKDELLVQVGRNLTPTPLGASLAVPVRKVLLQIQATIDVRPDFDPATSVREFRILASDYISTVLLGEFGRQVALIAPNIALDILPLAETQFELLDRADADLIILPRKFVSEAHPVQLLFEETYTCVVWKGNTGIGNTLSLDDYMRAGHVSSRFGNGHLSFEEGFLRSSGYDRRIEVSTTNFGSLPYFVIGTHRIATMHTRLARTLARYYPIRLLPPPIEFPTLEMCMQWNECVGHDPSHIWLRKTLADTARSDSPGYGPTLSVAAGTLHA